MSAELVAFPRRVANPRRSKRSSLEAAFARPFISLLKSDPAAAESLRRTAIDFDDFARLAPTGMDYSDWQRSPQRKQVNLKRAPADRSSSYRSDDWED